MLRVRTVEGAFLDRTENEWPLARTRWTRLYLDPEKNALSTQAFARPGQRSFTALDSAGITFSTPPLPEQTEITGPMAAKLFVSSSTSDADLFLVVRVFRPDGSEVVLQGAVDPHTPVSQGWLRASHRKLDTGLTTEYRPYHTHDEVQPLVPGEIYALDIEIWPTSLIVPERYRIALSVRGTDYEYEDSHEAAELSFFKGSKMRGVGIYTHADPGNRPPEIFGGTTTIHAGGAFSAYLLLPLIPGKAS
jgi:uncharacterized protein